MTPLARLAAAAGGPVLVLHDHDSGDATTGLVADGHEVLPLDGDPPANRRWGAVVLVVADRSALRAAVTSVPDVGESASVACLLTRDRHPVHLAPAPEWPRIVDLEARRLAAGGVLTRVALETPMPAEAVLRRLAQLAVPARSVPAPATAPRRGMVAEDGLGPLDEGVFNPIGFDPEPTRDVAELRVDGPAGLRLDGVAELDGVDLTAGAASHAVSDLRAHRGVRVRWTGATPELTRTVAELAMAGIPLVDDHGDPPPAASRQLLGEELHAALTAATDLGDPLRREEHSIGLRRAALLTHSRPAWRQRAATAAGRRSRRFPTCSVVLATRRPEQLDFALRQVVRQRGVDLEVVLVAHGFEPDPGRVRGVLGDVPKQVLSRSGDELFGDVLTAGVRASSGDVVIKMDDDDWYGRDFLLDLMLAREYSGADIVGAPAEMVYLDELHRTVRGRAPSDRSERFARFVAGGSLCLPRELLDAVGGFRPVRRFVDHQLLQAALGAGATVYRGHGLGYLLHRRAEGHTWHADADFFLAGDRVSQQWDGFAPSRLLEVEAADVPLGPSGASRP